MGEVIKVGMADLKTAKAPNTLTTLGLGSCIGLSGDENRWIGTLYAARQHKIKK